MMLCSMKMIRPVEPETVLVVAGDMNVVAGDMNVVAGDMNVVAGDMNGCGR